MTNTNIKDIILVTDLQVTCEDGHPLPDFEIFEITCTALSSKTFTNLGHFNEFVKPKNNPKLSNFCQNLTAVIQKNVDDADNFSIVYDKFIKWIDKNGFNNALFLTFGNWEFSVAIRKQAEQINIQLSKYFDSWCNISDAY